MRWTFVWRSAARLPHVIVATLATIRIICTNDASGAKSCDTAGDSGVMTPGPSRMRTPTANTAAFDPTARKPAIGAGAPS